MMIYSWTHTQRTATRLLHILSKPTSFLRDVQDQNEQALILQQKKQRRSVQQITEEQDRLEDDPNMTGATELMPVSMMNTRSVATMEESLPEDPEAQSVLADTSDDEDSSLPRKPKRRMDRYSNPFGTGVSSDDELEDDEGWFGRGDERSENGHHKTDSVLLTTPAKLTLHMNRNSNNNNNNNNKIPDFPISSLGAAMDPHQFENSSRDHHHNVDNSNNITRSSSSLSTFSTSSLFNTPRNVNLNRSTSSSTFANRSLSHPTDARPQSTLSVSTSAAFSARSSDGRPSSPPSPTMSETPHASLSKSSFQDTTRAFKHHDAAEARQESPSQFDSLPVDSPWADGHGVLSTSATFAEFASTVINTSTSGHSITSSSTISSFNGAVS
ncbi:hypothetical protein BGZ99_000637 [Dissophora globulifera]|uniref:Uncharacterized protein n=1 Tax=Dissophora globulifera TaxID=979702 RepID=A0A9P6R0D2_9FUNG|nr:hypothetical protein BGZ99_000637 [Dissophora globulifera]